MAPVVHCTQSSNCTKDASASSSSLSKATRKEQVDGRMPLTLTKPRWSFFVKLLFWVVWLMRNRLFMKHALTMLLLYKLRASEDLYIQCLPMHALLWIHLIKEAVVVYLNTKAKSLPLHSIENRNALCLVHLITFFLIVPTGNFVSSTFFQTNEIP